MSMTEDEARQEEWLLELYEEHSALALVEFKAERLRSYFLANPGIAVPAAGALSEARALLQVSPRAALVLAVASAEVALKSVLLKPVVHGLVHSEVMASHISDLVMSHRELGRFHELLFALLREAGDIDLTSFWRQGGAAALWSEIQVNARKRNAVVHQCQTCTAIEAERAIRVASDILDDLLPTVIGNFDLHMHDDWRICGTNHPSPEMQAIIDRIGRT